MNSVEFFKNEAPKWAGKQGIYVIEQPLFSKVLGRSIYKIGMARNSLKVRMGDYKNAYSPLIPFTIHIIYEVPERVGGRRANYALLTEQRIHATLKKLNCWEGGEWFNNLKEIGNVISSIRLQHLKEISWSNKWMYYNSIKNNIITPYELVSENAISSTLKNLIAMTDEEKDKRFNRGQEKKDYKKLNEGKKQPNKKIIAMTDEEKDKRFNRGQKILDYSKIEKGKAKEKIML